MKKIVLIMVGIIAVMAAGFMGYRTWMSYASGTELPCEEEVEFLNNKVEFELLLYGEDILWPENLTSEKIYDIKDETIARDSDYVFLVINDLTGNVEFTKEDIQRLVKYADKNTNFNFYYIGADKLSMIKENVMDCNLDDNDMSFGYTVYEGDRVHFYGVWSTMDHSYYSEQNRGLLGESICSGIYAMVKSNE